MRGKEHRQREKQEEEKARVSDVARKGRPTGTICEMTQKQNIKKNETK